jgi:hypothetical protein
MFGETVAELVLQHEKVSLENVAARLSQPDLAGRSQDVSCLVIAHVVGHHHIGAIDENDPSLGRRDFRIRVVGERGRDDLHARAGRRALDVERRLIDVDIGYRHRDGMCLMSQEEAQDAAKGDQNCPCGNTHRRRGKAQLPTLSSAHCER